MSQAGIISTAAAPVPPTVPEEFQTDVNSPAIPAANVLIEVGGSVTANNNNGIRTDGSSGGNTLTIQLTNRLQGTSTSIGATTTDIITFAPTVVGTYSLEFRISVFNTTSVLGAGYSLFGAIRFDGVNSNICDIFDEIVNEEGAMTNLDIAVVVAGANTIVRGTGYLGQTINWAAVGLYTFIGV